MRTYYLLLVLLRAYCATVPSYIHPDEHFQGPEIVIGRTNSASFARVDVNLHDFGRSNTGMADLQDLGIHINTAYPEHVPPMARLWTTLDTVEMDLGRLGLF